tara:strand:- start:717 stop:929 length:213 start_codon:yes stop_codon:yes gene_type:complete
MTEENKEKKQEAHPNAGEISITLDILKEQLEWKSGEAFLVLLDNNGKWTISKTVVPETDGKEENEEEKKE